MTAIDHDPGPIDYGDDDPPPPQPPPRGGGPNGQHDTLRRPHDPTAELRILAGLLLNPDTTTALVDLHLDGGYEALRDPTTQRLARRAHHQHHTTGAIDYQALAEGDTDRQQRDHRNRIIEAQALLTDARGLELATIRVADLARQRRTQDAAYRLATALSDGDDQAAQQAQDDLQAAQASADATVSSWAPQDLTGLLEGTITRPTPQLLALDDDQHHLLYPGKIHAFNAESESGKSWLALHAAAQEMRCGAHVLYLDFEDDAAGVTDRLIALGVPPQLIVSAFRYVRPDDPHDAAAAAQVQKILQDHQPTLAVLDGVTEALVLNGWEINSNDDAARFAVQLLRPIADAGPAVVLIDHVTKDKDQQGSHAIGAQHKKAFITGAAYKLEVRRPFGQGRRGEARIHVTKDRPGAVRGWALDGKIVGTFHLASTTAGDATAGIQLAQDATGGDDTFRPTHLMEAASREIERQHGIGHEPTGNEIATCVKGTKAHILTAVRTLVDEGYVTVRPQGRAVLHAHQRPYREVDDPRSDRYEPDPVEPPEEDF